MASISKISGIEKGGGGGVSSNDVANSGLQFFGDVDVWANSAVTAEYNVGPASSTHTFTKIEVDRTYLQFWGLKSNGTLWYWMESVGLLSSGVFTADKTWRQYGTDTDWTDISAGELSTVLAVKGGNLWFAGNGTYRQRGDNSTTSAVNFVQVNAAGDWVKCKLGYRCSHAINSSGEGWSTGYGYDYMTGLGTTGTIAIWTREKNSLTNLVDVKYGYRCSFWLNSSGDVYFSGNNAAGVAGPQITTSTNQNGPLLAVDSSTNYVCAQISDIVYSGGCHIDSDGYLRFSGQGTTYLRPDNSTTSAQHQFGGLQLTSAGSGWTYYKSGTANGSTAEYYAVGIKNGTVYYGGRDFQSMKSTFGGTPSQTWTSARSGTIAAHRAGVIAIQ